MPTAIDRRQLLERLALLPLAVAATSAVGCSATATSVDSNDAASLDSRAGSDIASSSDGKGASTDTTTKAGSDTAESRDADTDSSTDSSSDAGGAQVCSTEVGTKASDQPPSPCTPTGADLEGPYYAANAPSTSVLTDDNEAGESLRVTGRIYAKGCKLAIAGATIELWHADATGKYRDLTHATPLRATLKSDCNGRFAFDTILPGAYLDLGGYRPRHIHMKVRGANGIDFTTQLYFAGDPFLSPKDSCGVCKSGNPTHIIALKKTTKAGKKYNAGHFDVIV